MDDRVTLSTTTVTVDEAGGIRTYTIVLTAQPTGDVTITPESGDPMVARVSPSQLTFTTANWDTPQEVTVTGVNDDIDSDRTTTISHGISGGGYGDATVGQVRVTATDDDTAGLTLSTTALAVDEAGGIRTYTIVLTAQPTGNVRITPESGDPTVARVSPSQLTFTTANWDTPQEVTVTGVDDSFDNDPDRTTTISHGISGGGYGDTTVGQVRVTATDDDTAGLTLSITALTVNEASGIGTYTVRLNTLPTANVEVTPTSSDPMVATVSGAFPLTFTALDWNVPQTVTVTGVDDNVLNDPDRTTMVTHEATGGGYNLMDVANVMVTATDTNTPGVTLSTSTVSVLEAGGRGTYTVVLDRQPTAEVTVTRPSTMTPGWRCPRPS